MLESAWQLYLPAYSPAILEASKMVKRLGSKPIHARRGQKKKEALERNSKHSKLTPTQKLARLDQHLGFGIGATRERARLEKEMSKKGQENENSSIPR